MNMQDCTTSFAVDAQPGERWHCETPKRRSNPVSCKAEDCFAARIGDLT
jgi:hypothetical protein